ncbi:MAG: hypothetical protein CVU99_06745 [Firmicutes bacterium HGW-Firmicutes-4]|nr:MAG: hypothetical protein CVU99_06745 [Firmicutes bacterium HGW-Firmicutes-4]
MIQADLDYVTNLAAAGKGITTIEGIGQLKNLTTLDLSNNNISSLPDELGSLTKLTGLNLSSNNINTVPDAFYLLTELTNLNMAGNSLTGLSDKIGYLVKLKTLNLNGNALTGLGTLQDLNLSNNAGIINLPLAMGNLTGMTHLNVTGTGVTQLPLSMKGKVGITVDPSGLPYGYTVTYDSKGGTAVASASADLDTTLTKPSDPTRTGYNFYQRTRDNEGTTAWDFLGDRVQDIMTLYGQWLALPAKITFV